ncbi:MAG TPA: Maf family protein [Balneolaceae bacterium]|nr:Maf family protein [Balneolaceae bacterium]
MNSIILASASPRRKKLLQQINLPFQVHPSTVDETFSPQLKADQIVQQLALRKAKDVAAQFKDALIIGADTIVAFEDEILTKPEDSQDAKNMLGRLSGQTHQVYTGVGLCKVDSQNNITESTSFFERTEVTFGSLNPEDIDAYAASGSPLDKAGAYGIQDDFGAIFVKGIEGDFYNVMGFPLHSFYEIMHSFAPECLSKGKELND